MMNDKVIVFYFEYAITQLLNFLLYKLIKVIKCLQIGLDQDHIKE